MNALQRFLAIAERNGLAVDTDNHGTDHQQTMVVRDPEPSTGYTYIVATYSPYRRTWSTACYRAAYTGATHTRLPIRTALAMLSSRRAPERPFQVIYWHGHTHTATHYVDAVSAADAIKRTQATYPGQVFDAEAHDLSA